jgi:hypothetical protein
MRTANLATQALRQSESGQKWEEVITGGAGTFVLQPYQTFRVAATGVATVTIDGILAMTMATGQIEKFNCGSGLPTGNPNLNYPPGMLPPQSLGKFSTIVITGTANVQVARDNVSQPYGGA